MKKKKSRRSRVFKFSLKELRTQIVIMILGCWIIPVVILGLTNTVLYNMSYRNKINQSVINELYYSGMLTSERIETEVNILRKLNSEKEFDNAYKSMNTGEFTKKEFSDYIRAYIRRNYPVNSSINEIKYTSADIIFNNNINYHFYFSNETLEKWFDYRNRLYPVLLEKANLLESRNAGVHVEEDGIYLFRKIIMDEKTSITNHKSDYAVVILKLSSSYIFEYMLNDRFWESNVLFSVNENAGYLDEKIPASVSEETMNSLALSPLGTLEKRGDHVVTGGRARGDLVDFRYAILIQNSIIYAENTTFLAILTTVFLIIIPVLILATYYIFRKLNKPITALVSGTQKIKEGELGSKIEYKGDDEFGYLIDSFNTMSQTLKELFERSYKEEMALRDAKILALQAQINPHFMNNTLELMNWKARMRGDESLSKMIESLSVMLDAGMNRSNRRIIELSEELETVDAYLYIISVRFGERISVIFNVDDEILDALIPPMTLQPLIENAVTHGIEPVFRGTINISAYEINGELNIDIENDGKELSDDDIKKINKNLMSVKPADINEFNKESGQYRLGIRNVDERIRLIYGNSYGLTIKKLQNRHTLNKIVMPLSHNEQK